jgi:hypothetical protein
LVFGFGFSFDFGRAGLRARLWGALKYRQFFPLSLKGGRGLFMKYEKPNGAIPLTQVNTIYCILAFNGGQCPPYI